MDSNQTRSGYSRDHLVGSNGWHHTPWSLKQAVAMKYNQNLVGFHSNDPTQFIPCCHPHNS